MWVFPKIGKTSKMDGENNGKPYFLMGDLGVPLFLETPMSSCSLKNAFKKKLSIFGGRSHQQTPHSFGGFLWEIWLPVVIFT